MIRDMLLLQFFTRVFIFCSPGSKTRLNEVRIKINSFFCHPFSSSANISFRACFCQRNVLTIRMRVCFIRRFFPRVHLFRLLHTFVPLQQLKRDSIHRAWIEIKTPAKFFFSSVTKIYWSTRRDESSWLGFFLPPSLSSSRIRHADRTEDDFFAAVSTPFLSLPSSLCPLKGILNLSWKLWKVQLKSLLVYVQLFNENDESFFASKCSERVKGSL